MTERDTEILECIVSGWIDSGMAIPGDVSYRDVQELLGRLGVDASKIAAEVQSVIDIGEKIKKGARDIMQSWRKFEEQYR